MNISLISVGSGIALFFLSLLVGLEIYFLFIENMFLLFAGAVGLLYCFDNFATALRSDGVIKR